MTCPRCSTLLNTCASCDYNNKCSFKNDHSEPQMVTQQIRQGFMSGTIQTKNPNLIEKHCVSCRCSWGNKGECSKDNNGVACNHYRVIPDLLQSGVPIPNK